MTALMQTGSICLVALVFVSAVPDDEQAEDSTAAETVKELSAPPLDHVEYPGDRPLWLDQDPDLESRIHTWVVVTHPCETSEESAERLAIAQRAAVSSYVRALTGSEDVEFYPINDRWIDSQLIVESYRGKLTKGCEPMYEQAVMLEFTPRIQQEILAAWKNIQVRERLGALGVMVFFGLITLIGSSSLLGLIGRRYENRPLQTSR
jgi:hypothetical protein